MLPQLRRTRIAATAIALTFTAACTASQSTEESGADSAATSPSSPTATAAPADTSSAAPDAADGALRLQITVENVELTATLHDSAASRDLIAQLPLTLSMSDHGSVEKTGRLPEPLSLDGQPDGADPVVGDIGYYAPGNDLVLYYGDQDYYDGIVRLGTLNGDVEALARYDEVTVQIERATS